LNEVQKVTCDATNGTFLLTFNGYTTPVAIPHNANAATIESALEQIEIINDVTVSFDAGLTTACFRRTTGTVNDGFSVTFVSVQNMAGDLPLMGAATNGLSGARYINIVESQAGSAPIGGTFRLSFRGSITEDICATVVSNNYDDIADDIATKLQQLDTISYGGISVSSTRDELPTSDRGQLYRITFTGADLGGDVEAIENVGYFNKLTGSGVNIAILTDGLQTAEQRGWSNVSSIAGNEVGGTFTLTYRGHTTTDIDFNVADSVLKSAIEALPNINTVDVRREGPSVYKEYTWFITFMSMPGSYPDGTENVLPLIPNSDGLSGTSTVAAIVTAREGSDPLGGTFSLIMTTANPDNSLLNVTEIASNIPADASASELQAVLNALESIGTVSVSRRNLVNGLQWLITFDGCKIVNGVDVCNMGDVDLLRVNNTLMACGRDD